jgi:hypothetical protein
MQEIKERLKELLVKPAQKCKLIEVEDQHYKEQLREDYQ